MKGNKVLILAVAIAALLALVGAPIVRNRMDIARFDLRVVHPHSLSYWEWSAVDERYLREGDLSRGTLLKELYALHEHSRRMLEQVQVINNFTFFPSYVTATVHALDRAKEARIMLLRDGVLGSYPQLGSLGLLDFIPALAHTDVRILRNKRKADHIIADTLKSLPFDTAAFRGTRVKKVPFRMDYIGFAERGQPNGAIFGFAKRGRSPSIVIGADSGLVERVLYHEIGHVWDFIYLDTYAEYLAIREQSDFIPRHQWAHRIEENFAEDFAAVMGAKNHRFFRHMGIFGLPTPEQTTALSAWMQGIIDEGRPHRTHLLVNERASLGNTIITKGPYLRFHGAVAGEYYVTVLDPDFAVRSFPLAETTSAELTLPLPLCGFYTLGTPNGAITVIRLDDNYSFPAAANAFGPTTSTFLDGETWNWITFLHGSMGLWLRPAGDAVYVLINDGAATVRGTGLPWTGRKIDLARIEYRDDRTIIHIVEGERPFLVLRLPLDRHAKPIELARGAKR